MDLKGTVDLMLSDSWKDRLAAEYWQTRIRLTKLKQAEHRPLKDMQVEIMEKYLDVLRARAEYENVNLVFSST